MRYCNKCVLPDTRPGIMINADGVCSACVGYSEKGREINWDDRKKDFESLIADARRRSRGYDCIIPVSGGKDSTWQTVRCLEYGLRILAVTWKTPARTEIGQKNLDNLISLGVDHIDFTINPKVERKFTYKAFVTAGDPGLPMHMAIYAIPLRMAVALNIPLVIWGESPHMEYGGSQEQRKKNSLNLEWFKKHNILQGTSVDDWVDDDLTPKDLEAYHLPTAQEFDKSNIQSIFLGFYFPWDVEESLRVAKANNFSIREEGPKVGYYNYADIDCNFISLHHYFKWFKFGFTRLFDNLSIEIRNNRISREEAIATIAKIREQTPHDDIEQLCRFLQISTAHFWEIAERFRNPKVWKKVGTKWIIPDFIVQDWKW
jgi:N-acetyl sugar amidotransferase